MAIDPVCGMGVSEETSLNIESKGRKYFFCSLYCLEKFIKEKNISINEEYKDHCNSSHVKRKKIYKDKTFLLTVSILFICIASFYLNFLAPFRNAFLLYLKQIWWALLVGVFLGGLIERYIPREYISQLFSKPRKRTIFYSVFFGFMMSVCSHGILAISIELYRKGASIPAVVSFLLASPWANLPLTLILFGFFGMKAFYIIFSAIVVAIVTGFIFQYLDSKNLIEKSKNTMIIEESYSIIEDIKRRSKQYRFTPVQIISDIKEIINGSIMLSGMIIWWILLGMVIASVIAGYVPQHFFHRYLSASISGLFITLFIAIIIEICSEGTAPLAFEIYRQTCALGNSTVFLLAGVVTDYTEIGLLWSNIGKKTAIWLPIVSVPQVLFLGFIANLFF